MSPRRDILPVTCKPSRRPSSSSIPGSFGQCRINTSGQAARHRRARRRAYLSPNDVKRMQTSMTVGNPPELMDDTRGTSRQGRRVFVIKSAAYSPQTVACSVCIRSRRRRQILPRRARRCRRLAAVDPLHWPKSWGWTSSGRLDGLMLPEVSATWSRITTQGHPATRNLARPGAGCGHPAAHSKGRGLRYPRCWGSAGDSRK